MTCQICLIIFQYLLNCANQNISKTDRWESRSDFLLASKMLSQSLLKLVIQATVEYAGLEASPPLNPIPLYCGTFLSIAIVFD